MLLLVWLRLWLLLLLLLWLLLLLVICEGAVQIEAAFATRGYVVRVLGELDPDLDDL